MKNIVIIGSGWASASFLKNINNDDNKYNITIISPTKEFIYTPLMVNSIFNNLSINYNILNINQKNNINKNKYIQTKINDIDFEKKKVIFHHNSNSIEYDYLILAYGSEINTFNIPGVNENCLFIKDKEDITKIKNKLINLNKLKNKPNIAIIGCGLTGTELIGNLLDCKKYNIYAIDGLSSPLTIFNNTKISNYIINLWNNYKVQLYFNNFVQKIDNKKIYFKNDVINYDLVFWCGGIKASSLTLKLNKKLNNDCKFGLPVNNKLEVINTKNVFALGDCGFNKTPPSAQVAYQEGKYLASCFNNNFKNKKDFIFSNKGQVCYVGKGKSVYSYKKIYFHGSLTGYLNNFIHLYNAINIEQSYSFCKNMFNKK